MGFYSFGGDFERGATTCGATRQEALEEAAGCLEEVLSHLASQGFDIPSPSPAQGRPVVAAGAGIAAKTALHLALGKK